MPAGQRKSTGLGDAVVHGLLVAPVEAAVRGVGARVGGGNGVSPVLGRAAPALCGALTLGAALSTGPGVPLALGALVGAPAAWAAVHGDSFRRLAAPAVRNWYHRVAVYGNRWEEAMTNCALMKRYGSEARYPQLLGVGSSEFFDHVWVRLLPGQTMGQVQLAAVAIAETWGSDVCRVHRVKSRRRRHTRVRLDLQRRDALRETVAPLPIVEDCDLDAVPVGRTEYGETWYFELLDTHTLIGGATGAGKASVLWSLIRGVAPAVRDGRVELWGIDPKGGQELVHARSMFTRYEGEGADVEHMLAMLLELVAYMEARTRKFAADLRRKHEPTLEDPAILCIIDELADLTLCSNGTAKNAIINAIEKLLRRGRSVGIYLVMALQDVAKGAVPFRGLIPTGVGLRLDDAQWQVDAVLGPGAFNRGANCLEIPGKPGPGQEVDGRGVGYVTRLGVPEPLRVRASYVTDEDLAAMARDYPAPRQRSPLAPEEIARLAQLGDGYAEAVEQEFSEGDEREPSKA